jgi:hypothetical protein
MLSDPQAEHRSQGTRTDLLGVVNTKSNQADGRAKGHGSTNAAHLLRRLVKGSLPRVRTTDTRDYRNMEGDNT